MKALDIQYSDEIVWVRRKLGGVRDGVGVIAEIELKNTVITDVWKV